MKSISQINKRYLPHELKTRIYAVETYRTRKSTYYNYLSIKFITYFKIFSFYLKHNYHSFFSFKQKKTNYF